MPHLTVTNVVEWPYKSGQLSARQIEITDSEPSQLLKMLASGAWTAQEVLLAFIARCIIAHHLTNPLTDPMFDQGFRRAVELDDYHRRTGKTAGPFHGLPISLIDVFNMQGMPTTLGFVARANAHPLYSGELVNRLSAAGAIFYCKTNIPQSLMSGECHNFLFGRTATPYNTTLSAGGSSGGEGSLIALGGSPLGIGSDIAGSIRTRANFNGIYGLCPTNGRLPLHDAEQSNAGYLINGVAGPLSKSIDRLEVYARTLLSLKPWEWDSACERLPWDEQIYQETLLIGLSGKRQLCLGFVANDRITTPHPPIQRGMRETRATLEKAGVQVVDVQLFDGTEGMWEMITRIFSADGGNAFREEIAKSGEPISEEIELANPQDAMNRTSSLAATGRPVDVFVLPSGCRVASPHGTMKYWLYESISNILDWTCATIPVGHVDFLKDPKPSNGGDFKPLSSLDRDNWNLYSPELYSDAPTCLQVLGQKFTEEKVLACLRVIEA
ncbi:amidase signature domain-containing protein [Fusarium oxysporum f. sp. albedinis]|nr:amidase signature domain-containing protein [Fusarium oxysporum f. sp. albedinis]